MPCFLFAYFAVQDMGIECAGVFPQTGCMAKIKNPAIGEGFSGEIMVHKISHAMGVMENVTLSQAGWPPQIMLKLADGTLKKGRLSDFRDPSGNEGAKFSPVQNR
jgi:hypothetical protein